MTINLNYFCDANRTAYIDKPWSFEDNSYATNGCILIRIARCDDIPERDTAPKVNDTLIGYFPRKAEILTAFPFFLLPDVAPVDCADCAGMGHLKKCKECGGSGKGECLCCSQPTDCEACDGKGYKLSDDPEDEVCEKCNGTGSTDPYEGYQVKIGDAHIDLKYALLLQSLPNIKIAVRHPIEALPFSFDGGEGALMPMSGGGSNVITVELDRAAA